MGKITGLVIAMLVAGVFLCGVACAVVADTSAVTAGQNKAAVVDAGNKICPVTGAKVDGKDYYEYNGKRYGLCCSMCPAVFAKDPAKYSAIADKEVAGAK